MLYAYIEDEYGMEAEDEIKSFFNFANCKLTYENNDELVAIDSKKLKEVKLRYEALENEYSKGIEIFKKEIMQLENEKNLIQKDNELMQIKLNNITETCELKLRLKEYELDKYKQKSPEVNKY